MVWVLIKLKVKKIVLLGDEIKMYGAHLIYTTKHSCFYLLFFPKSSFF